MLRYCFLKFNYFDFTVRYLLRLHEKRYKSKTQKSRLFYQLKIIDKNIIQLYFGHCEYICILTVYRDLRLQYSYILYNRTINYIFINDTLFIDIIDISTCYKIVILIILLLNAMVYSPVIQIFNPIIFYVIQKEGSSYY